MKQMSTMFFGKKLLSRPHRPAYIQIVGSPTKIAIIDIEGHKITFHP